MYLSEITRSLKESFSLKIASTVFLETLMHLIPLPALQYRSIIAVLTHIWQPNKRLFELDTSWCKFIIHTS